MLSMKLAVWLGDAHVGPAQGHLDYKFCAARVLVLQVASADRNIQDLVVDQLVCYQLGSLIGTVDLRDAIAREDCAIRVSNVPRRDETVRDCLEQDARAVGQIDVYAQEAGRV
mmetsp:Transcript_24839/g.55208  ORF Transcript_24839/g.55208 Transcript_24839/m.55208 type:complete len:113 (+) Transcript_24839:31-369(+)